MDSEIIIHSLRNSVISFAPFHLNLIEHWTFPNGVRKHQFQLLRIDIFDLVLMLRFRIWIRFFSLRFRFSSLSLIYNSRCPNRLMAVIGGKIHCMMINKLAYPLCNYKHANDIRIKVMRSIAQFFRIRWIRRNIKRVIIENVW